MVDINNINMNLLKFFIVAAESNSLNEVSEKMGYNISTISTNVTELERQLGVILFTRNPLKLTEIGKDIYDAVKEGFKDIKFASVIANSKNDISCGIIKIGCPSHITDFFLMKRIVRATKEYKNLKIELDCESNHKELINKLLENEIDFAILDNISNDEINNIKIEKIMDSNYIFVANKEIKIKNIEDLNNYKFILSNKNKNSTSKLMNILKKYDILLDNRIICPTTEMRVKAAKMGVGIAYVIEEAVKDELENQKLYKVELPIELPKGNVSVVTLDGYTTKVAKKFIKDYIKEDIK